MTNKSFYCFLKTCLQRNEDRHIACQSEFREALGGDESLMGEYVAAFDGFEGLENFVMSIKERHKHYYTTKSLASAFTRHFNGKALFGH